MMSRKQQSRMAAKARRRHYIALRDKLRAARPRTWEYAEALVAYVYRVQVAHLIPREPVLWVPGMPEPTYYVPGRA